MTPNPTRYRSQGRSSELPSLLTRKKVPLRSASKSRFSQNREKSEILSNFTWLPTFFDSLKICCFRKFVGYCYKKLFPHSSTEQFSFFCQSYCHCVLKKNLETRNKLNPVFNCSQKDGESLAKKKRKTIQTLMTNLARLTNVSKFVIIVSSPMEFLKTSHKFDPQCACLVRNSFTKRNQMTTKMFTLELSN